MTENGAGQRDAGSQDERVMLVASDEERPVRQNSGVTLSGGVLSQTDCGIAKCLGLALELQRGATGFLCLKVKVREVEVQRIEVRILGEQGQMKYVERQPQEQQG
jgi:hypothetical protein